MLNFAHVIVYHTLVGYHHAQSKGRKREMEWNKRGGWGGDVSGWREGKRKNDRKGEGQRVQKGKGEGQYEKEGEGRYLPTWTACERVSS